MSHETSTRQTVLFCIPLKKRCLRQYQDFAKQTVERAKEYKEMLIRYDIHCAKIWHKNIGGNDYVFVYHEVGPQFKEKMKGWDISTHPFDQWFRNEMMTVYDIKDASGMETPKQLVDFRGS